MPYMNRLANASNKFQGQAKRVLCVCSAGLLRSPTAANVLHREYGHNTRACGASPEYALIPIDAVLIAWADEVVFVEKRVHDLAQAEFKDMLADKRIVILAIPDKYEWGDPHLQDLIRKQYEDVTIFEKAL
mgnify:CR=1 FL=1